MLKPTKGEHVRAPIHPILKWPGGKRSHSQNCGSCCPRAIASLSRSRPEQACFLEPTIRATCSLTRTSSQTKLSPRQVV